MSNESKKVMQALKNFSDAAYELKKAWDELEKTDLNECDSFNEGYPFHEDWETMQGAIDNWYEEAKRLHK